MGIFDSKPRKPAISLTRSQGAPGALETADELPVVARMVIEIRSDGSRTVARGALEDSVTGERVVIEAHGSTPMALAASLTGTLTKGLIGIPSLARHSVKALFKGALRRK